MRSQSSRESLLTIKSRRSKDTDMPNVCQTVSAREYSLCSSLVIAPGDLLVAIPRDAEGLNTCRKEGLTCIVKGEKDGEYQEKIEGIFTAKLCIHNSSASVEHSRGCFARLLCLPSGTGWCAPLSAHV